MVLLGLEDVLGDSHGDVRRQATLVAIAATDPSQRCAELRSLDPPLDHLLDFAERNRVGPIVAHRILDTFPNSPVLARARHIHQRAAVRMEVLLGELDVVACRLARDGIRLVALKNGGIARGVYPCSACCPMGDVDTLVERGRFRDAHRLMLECGFSLATRAPGVEPADLEHGMASGGSEYQKRVGDHDVWFELQWRAVAGRFFRREQEPDGEVLLAAAVPIDGTDVRLLRPEDNLVQVCLHTAKHSYVRAPGLRLHTDVDRLTTFTPPVWSDFLEQVETLSVRTAAYFSLALSQTLLGAPVPSRVLAALAPARWRKELLCRWLRHADLFEPDQRKFTRPAMMGFHALLFDSIRDLAASALDADPSRVTDLAELPRHLRSGAVRVMDLVSRYQR